MNNYSFRTLALAALLGVGSIAPARGQDTTEPDSKKPKRDPFALPDRSRGERRANGAAAVPVAIPKLALRGFIETADGERIALLEVESRRTYLVRKGDALTITATRGECALRIAEIDRSALRIEVGQSGRIVVVR